MQVGRTIKPLVLIILLLLLPPAEARDGGGMRVIPAQEILDKIERGEPVEYDHVIVEGDLDLGKMELPRDEQEKPHRLVQELSENVTIGSAPVRINDSTIEGSVSSNNSIFINSINFKESCFNDDANFIRSDFNNTHLRAMRYLGILQIFL